MIDLAQADGTLRDQDKPKSVYAVFNGNGEIVGQFITQATAIRYALAREDYKVVRQDGFVWDK